MKTTSLKRLCKNTGLLLGLLCLSAVGYSQNQVYFAHVAATMNDATHGVNATATAVTGNFATAPAWATGMSSCFQSTGSAGALTINFASPLALASCGANAGTIKVTWGATSNRPFNLTLNGGALTKIDEVTASAQRSLVREATYAIPTGTNSISSIKLSASGGGGIFVFTVEVLTCTNTPTLTLTPTSLSGFTYAEGMGPSAEKTFTVSGSNLTAGTPVSVTAPAGYEVSLTSGSGFGASASIPVSAATLAATTVYVRLAAGQTLNPSITGDVSVSGSGVTTAQKVALSGSVTAGPTITFTPNPLPTLTYIVGQGPSQIETIYISGTNLPAGDVKIVPVNLQLSTSATGTFAPSAITVVPNFAGGTLVATPFYIQHPAGMPVNTYTDRISGIVFDAGGNTALFNSGYSDIPFIVSPAPTNPTLLVNPTALTGLDYVFGGGASAAKSFNVSGALLTAGAAITITAPTNFEISLSATAGFGTTVSIPNAAGGTLANTPVYVRLAAGKAINPAYTGNVTVTGGGDATVYNVSVSGAVTPASLPAPAVGTPNNATEFGFTAHWTVVANASGGYIVNVYQGGTQVKSVPVGGQATAQTVINGLQPFTAYTYKVVAVGDGVNHANSPESAASAPITTLMASVTITSPCGNTMIGRYHTDFTGWATMSGGSSGAFSTIPGSGGFSAEGGINVNNGTAGISTGSSGRRVEFPPFNFSAGGSVIVEIAEVTNTNRTLSISGGASPASNAITAAGTYTFTYPPSFTGDQTLTLTFSNGGFVVKSITICSNPGTNPILTTTPLPTVTQSMQATVGGNADMKVIQVKGFNLTGDVSVSVVGDLAGYFTPTQTTIDLASALAGQNLGITYKSSSVPAMHSAQLKLSSAGAADVYVPLTGISTPAGGTQPIIIADTAELPFWTTVINEATQTLNVAGYNLTQNISLSITGADATFFSVRPQTISIADALKGYNVNIVYSGDITYGTEHSATLVITSSGVTVQVPLKGYTLEKRPELYELRFVVSPAQAGYVTHTPGGTIFLKGTVVKATVTPEPDYVIEYWSDAGGNRSIERSFTVSDLKKGVITIFLKEKGGVIVPPTADFVAYPPESITETSFTGSWSNAKDATGYTVKVYDANKNLIDTLPAGTANSLNITGLTPGAFYYYEVEAAVSSGTGTESTGLVGPFQTLKTPVTFTCGE